MILLILYQTNTIFTICWMGYIWSVLFKHRSWIPDPILGFVVDPSFVKPLNCCLVPIQLSIGSRDYGASSFGIIYFRLTLYLRSKNVSFQVTFYLRVSLEELKKDRISNLFLDNITLEVLKLAWKQSLHDHHKWIMHKYPGNISIADFDEYAIETQCEALTTKQGAV